MKKLLLVAGIALFGFNANAQEANKPVAGNVTTEIAVQGLINNMSFNIQDQAFGNGAMFKARYFKTENLAYRALVFANIQSETTKATPDDLKENTFGLGVGFGVEKHFTGTDRLSPYVGVDGILGFDSSKATQGSNETKGPNTFRIGVRGVFGADYYVAKKLYLGVEGGLGLFYKSTGKTEVNGTTTSEGGSSFSFSPSLVGGVRVGFVLF